MATLEIHDSRNRVRRVLISKENPVMFGTDPMCDVVLDGPGVQPFHGRIRWKTKRFKADASPEVPWIEVNGVQVKSKSIYQGDEIRVGQCRIFLLSLEEGPDHGEKTVFHEPPAAPRPASARPGPPAVDYHRMEMAPPSLEEQEPRATPYRYREPSTARDEDRSSVSREKPSSRRSGKKSLTSLLKTYAGQSASEDAPLVAAAKAQAKPLGKLGSYFQTLERAPGDDRVMGSPLVIGLVVSFGLLVVLSFSLWGMIARNAATHEYTVAKDDMESGNFVNAIKGFDHFLEANPKDRRSGKARVLRAMARVRQHTGSGGASWGNALIQARAMIDEVGQSEEYRDSSAELADELRKIAEGLADRAADLADRKELAEAEATVQLHGRVAGQAAGALVDRSRIPAKLEKARMAIRKGHDRVEALARMDAALKANSPNEAYNARDALVRSYRDLAGDREIRSRLALANDQVRAAITLDASGRPGEAEPRPEILGPATSLVLRLDPVAAPASNPGPMAYAVSDGALFALDAASGAPRWQVPVGLASPFPPLAVAGAAPSVMAFDSRNNDLIRLDARTGKMIWRQELEGPVADPPLILGNQVFQPTLDGRLVQIDLASGSVRGTLRVGRKLARTPVADDSAEHLYLLADEDCLFILTVDPLACVGVEYLGQEAGSVACPPAKVGRFYVVPENQDIDKGRWRVFVIDEAGTGIRETQEVPVGGWTTATPAAAGPVIWSCSDRGELAAYAVGLYESKAPFTLIARVAPNTELEGPAFPRVKSDRDFWLASSRSGRIELDSERGKFAIPWTLGESGPALAPPQAFDKILVLTQQHADGPGTSLWGVDPMSGQVRWRTVLGSAWPVGLAASTSGDGITTLAADGKPLTIGPDMLRRGGFVEQPLPKAGAFRLPPGMIQSLEVDGATVIVPGQGAARLLVRAGAGEFKSVELPAPLATAVLPLGKDLLVPGADGRVYLIDPRTGTSTADPYVPPFDRSKPVRWRSPVAMDGSSVALADSEATLRRITLETSGRPRLVASGEQKLDRPLAADPTSTGASILVATTEGKIRSLASHDLGPQGTWELDAPRLLGPVVVGDHAFVADSAGYVLAFSPDGRRLWTARLRDTIAAGPPALLDRSAWFLGRDGSVQRFSMLDGSPQSSTRLEVTPTGGPLASGPDLIVPTGIGSVRPLDLKGLDPPKDKGP